ncbi:major capsid protein [Frigoribacterium sp. VKM Ac-2530]|uniref:major capsid protein n=1 Tax=Frigoribacterium sp. VKM Ac-2530 TaxID=2783822 RepID=UPI00188B48CF|nr:major capsid protein [Frigoribacterium sp. VKM Ac-2530]MBF4578953.1 major capsid protein [Frigoribacterium sp. VKM Ac-2530]
MALWTDVIDPATLTGYARESLADIEARRGTLARWLPNRDVADTVVRFVMGQNGLVTEAKFRTYDAEPEVGKARGGRRVTLELPALGQEIPVSEYQQLRSRNASDDAILREVLGTTRQVVQAVSDRIERLRGTVLDSGKATIAQDNFTSDDDFGRSASHNVTAPTLWSSIDADRLGFLESIVDVYRETNGVDPGAIVLTNRVFRALSSGKQFQTQLLNGVSRPATDADVQAVVTGAGLPPIFRHDRRTSGGRVLSDDRLLLLPEPVETDDWEGTQLGATFWGQTLTSTDDSYQIEDADQPGIVAGVYRNEKPPMIAEVISDAIALPVLANANLSLSAKVL